MIVVEKNKWFEYWNIYPREWDEERMDSIKVWFDKFDLNFGGRLEVNPKVIQRKPGNYNMHDISRKF